MPAAVAPKRKLSYKEQRELDELPARIEALEAEQAKVHAELADPSFYAKQPDRIGEVTERNAQIEEELLALLERWEALGAR